MGEAKRRAERAAVTIHLREDPAMVEALRLASNLMTAIRAMNAGLGEVRVSAALSSALQTVILTDPEHEMNDVLNALAGATGWALHHLPEGAWAPTLQSMQRHIIEMAKDSALASRVQDAAQGNA